MRRWVSVVGILYATTLAGAACVQARSRLAPADEYFGPTAMSPLEITNRIHDAEVRGGSYRGLLSTQAAIEDWTRKYPGDPWIPPREYRMSRLFANLHSRDGAAEAARCREFIRAHFSKGGTTHHTQLTPNRAGADRAAGAGSTPRRAAPGSA
jgi:hypothetical protein